jgi:hypothetical protein
VYDAEGDLTMLFDLENSVAEEVHKQDCTFWQDLPYLRPAYTKEQFEHVSADRPPGEGGPET